MSADFTIGVGDTLPLLVATLQPAPGQTFTLAGSTVRFKAWRHSTLVIDAPADIVDETARRVSYAFTALDTASKVKLEGAFVVTFPGATDIQTFPNDPSSRFRISIG